ncbi:YmaF family protein [Paenibacillus sp. S-38]|uniref:YmaF family protein n=1 Tax=Paenibacillus sp. S-38 TaxID=3416710 RepID=UPI003CED0DBF
MDIPIEGVVICSDDFGGQHSHILYITSWAGRPVHVHSFAGITSFDVGHSHEYAGVTAPAPSGVPHVHEYHTETTFNDGHTHFIRGKTGEAIPLPGGGHYHYFQGFTTMNGTHPHAHAYQGRTGGEHM